MQVSPHAFPVVQTLQQRSAMKAAELVSSIPSDNGSPVLGIVLSGRTKSMVGDALDVEGDSFPAVAAEVSRSTASRIAIKCGIAETLPVRLDVQSIRATSPI